MTTEPDAAARRVGIVVHSGRAAARDAAGAAARRLRDRGVDVVGVDADAGVLEGVEVATAERFADGLDVVCVFGGDGTFLRAAWLVRDVGVPLLGVNLGRLGFLSEVEVADVGSAVERVVAGDWGIEERMTLAVDVVDADGAVVEQTWALNEASVERTVPQRLVVVEVRIDDRVFVNLPVDAIVVATPTGSTAYAFSARGPILSPLVDAILVVPVAPHTLFDRTVVIDPRETLLLRPTSGSQCLVTADGRDSLVVPAGGAVRIGRGKVPVRMARLGAVDFYGRIRSKFRLP